MGMKWTHTDLDEFNAIGHFKDRKYNMIIGFDDLYVPALATGAIDGDISSTINF